MGKKLTALLLTVIVILGASGRAFALEQGSISLTLSAQGTAVTGGTLGLYRVGDLGENGQVRLTVELHSAALKSDLDLGSAALAQALSEEVEKQNLSGTVQKVSDRGTVTFDNLERGVYLIKQETASDNSGDILPFLVAIPQTLGDTVTYQVDASPKVVPNHQDQPETSPAVSPAVSSGASPSVSPAVSGSPTETATLPKTGQLNWPTPLLALMGVLLVLVGCWMNRRRNDQ